MKSYLFRAIIKKYIRILVAIVLVSSLGCGMMTGMANGFQSLKTTLEEYLGDMNYPDAVVETEVMNRDILEDIASVPGVAEVNARLEGNTVLITGDGGYYTMQTITWSDREFQGVHYWEKTEEESDYPVLVEYKFAVRNNIHAGDLVEIRVEDRSWNCLVKGLISRPEMIASHKVGDMEVISTDIGFVYVPDEVVDKIDNPDYDKASSEWDEKNKELSEKEEDAKEEYQSILDNLDDAEKMLKDKQKELDDLIKQAGLKKEELLKYKEEILKRFKELEEKEKELQDKRKELDEGWEKFRNAEGELNSGKEELKKKKEELDSAKKTLESTKEELQNQLKQIEEKEKELAKTKQELQNARDEIANKLRELDDTEKKLKETKEELQNTITVLKDLRDFLVKTKKYIAELDELIRKAEEMTDAYEWAKEAVDELDKILADTDEMIRKLESIRDMLIAIDEQISRAEAEGRDISDLIKARKEILEILEKMGISQEQLDVAIAELKQYSEEMRRYREDLIRLMDESANPEKIEEIRKRLIESCRKILEQYKDNPNFSDAVIDEMIAQIDVSIKEAEDGIVQIDDGLKQIADGRALLKEKDKEAEDGLRQIADGEKQLSDAKAAVTDGLAQVEDGLKQLAEGYREIEKYEKEIKDAEEQIRSARAELNEYEKQWADAERVLKEAREALEKSEKEVDDAIKQIDDEISKGKNQFESSKDELTKSKKTAEENWLDVLGQFSDVKSELKKAREELDEWHGYGVFCNQVLLRLEPEANPDETLSEVEKVIGDKKIKNSYTYEDSAVKRHMDANLGPLEIMSLYVPLLFYLVALIVECLFMSFMIRQCRREIGILRALGFTGNSIVMLFCIINAVVSVGGIALGQLIAFGVCRYTGHFFRGYFSLYFFDYVFHWKSFLISVILTVLVGQLATIISGGFISRVLPSEAMSRQAPPQAFMDEKGIFSVLHMPPFVKFSIFSLLRNKLRLGFSLLCLSSSVVLIFSALMFDFSKNRILSQVFEDRIRYDCEVFFSSEPDEELLRKLSDSGLVQDEEVLYYYSKEITANDATDERIVRGVPTDSELIGIFDGDENRIYTSDEGILLEKHTAIRLKVSEGDTVMLDGVPMKVVAIPDEYENRYQYVSPAAVQELGKPEMYSVVCNVKTENERELQEFLSKEENYIYATFTGRMYEGLEDGFNAFGLCAMVIMLFSVSIGLVVVINTIRTNLQDQKKELCVLRTLGFQYSSLSVRLFSQSSVYFIFACLIGVPAGIVVTKIILNKLEIESRSYPFVDDPRVYILTLMIVLAYIVASHFISMRAMRKWDMVETVKDKE